MNSKQSQAQQPQPLPIADRQSMQFENGAAIGTAQRWIGGQYCSIMTAVGIVGCGIYDLNVAEQFGQAIAIARGTPAHPLRVPEDLLDAKIVELTPAAASLGIQAGWTGRQAVEAMLQAANEHQSGAQ